MSDFEEIGLVVGDLLGEVTQNFEYEFQSVTMKDPNSKYKLSSAMQKCIRRGMAQKAMFYAQALLHGGAGDYLWRRLPVISLEDVGLADLALCAQVIHFCRFKAVRTAIGEEKGLCYLVSKMAEGMKSRTLCDMVCMAYSVKYVSQTSPTEYYPELMSDSFKAMMSWGWKPEPKDCEFVWKQDSEENYTFIGAGSYISKEDQLAFVLKHGGDFAAYCLYAGAKKGAELHGVLFPAYKFGVMEGAPLSLKETKVLPEMVLLNGVPDFAFDQHVLEGQRAIAYVLKSSNVLKAFTTKTGITLQYSSLSMAVFQTESALLDKQMVGGKMEKIQAFNDDLELKSVGVSHPENQKELVKALNSTMFRDELLYARKRVLGLVPSANN